MNSATRFALALGLLARRRERRMRGRLSGAAGAHHRRIWARLGRRHFRARRRAKLSQILGQQFVVEARPGGGSNIAAEFVARAPKDGYTLLLGNVANTVSAALGSNPSFDFARDLAPIARVTAFPILLAGHPSLGATDVKDLIAAAKEKPRQTSTAPPASAPPHISRANCSMSPPG